MHSAPLRKEFSRVLPRALLQFPPPHSSSAREPRLQRAKSSLVSHESTTPTRQGSRDTQAPIPLVLFPYGTQAI
jgi:hypothetical protein